MKGFKPNIYPMMYWGLLFGIVAGFIVLVMRLLAEYIVALWFPIFLVGLVYGGYRNYQKQRKAFVQNSGKPAEAMPVVEELKEAAQDIVTASKDAIVDSLRDEGEEVEIDTEEAVEEDVADTTPEEDITSPERPTPPTI